MITLFVIGRELLNFFFDMSLGHFLKIRDSYFMFFSPPKYNTLSKMEVIGYLIKLLKTFYYR